MAKHRTLRRVLAAAAFLLLAGLLLALAGRVLRPAPGELRFHLAGLPG